MNAAPRFARAAALLLAVSGAAGADEAFRCGKWVVTSSLALGELISKCGPPTTRTSRTEDVRARNPNNGFSMRVGETTIETLTWSRGSSGAPMVVVVQDGVIKSIERGS